MSIIPSHDQCLSLENICHTFLMLHCRRMSWECKYNVIQLFFGNQYTNFALFMLSFDFHKKHTGREDKLERQDKSEHR